MTPTRKERQAEGKALRDRCARVAHARYRATLSHERRALLDRYEFKDIAASRYHNRGQRVVVGLTYAEQNERDHHALQKAIRDGRIETFEE